MSEYERDNWVCVGGPDHGRMVKHSGEFVHVPRRLSVDKALSLHGGMPGGCSIDNATYRREQFDVSFGSMKLTGTAWVWDGLKSGDGQVARAAIGLLVSSMLGSES